jgi:hypothetical protein
MGDPLRAGAVVAMGLVATYCLLRSVAPAWRSPVHGPGVERWHLAMSGAMLVMLLSPVRGAEAAALVGLFAVAAGWALPRLRQARVRAASARLLLGCAAMAAMLTPAAASAATPHPAMPGMDAASTTSTSAWLVLGLLVATLALVVMAVRAVVHPGSGLVAARLGGCCELLMGLAMLAMTLPLLG